jgi:hypothetical protein
MSAPLPFSVSPEAADYLRSVMRAPAAGDELALITVLRQGEMVDGREQVWFEGEHFMLGVYDVGRRPHAEHVELLGHRVSIVPSTLESLRGRTLTIRRVPGCSGESRVVLVVA